MLLHAGIAGFLFVGLVGLMMTWLGQLDARRRVERERAVADAREQLRRMREDMFIRGPGFINL